MVDDEDEQESVDASLDELLAKRAEEKADEEEDDSVLDLGRDDRAETLAIKVLPQQADEFTCNSCFLVKHRSQIADKKKLICRDCA